MTTPEYLDTPTAAQATSLSKSTLNKLRLVGGGPEYLKLGRRVVYPRDTLDVWMRSHRRMSTSDRGGGAKAA
jgi:predicted DNA-binding transcriptional regulator AlpA